MTLLYITHSCPYPPNKGDRIRSFHILKYLSTKYDVKLIYPSFTRQDMLYIEDLRKYCVSVHTCRMRKIPAYVRCVSSLVSGSPMTLQFFRSKYIEDMVNSTDFDIAIVDCSSMAQYVEQHGKKKIIDFVDVDYEKWLMYASKANFFKKFLYKFEYEKLKRYEMRINKGFDYSIVISEREKHLLQEPEKVAVISNGVDFKKFAPMDAREEHTIIFSGAMDYFANVDGVLFFCQEILPLVKKAVPRARFVIAGMNPVQKVRQLAREDVIVTGYVEDMRSHVARATVFVAPLRIAKGIQNKVLEAMAMEIPVVATRATSQGIGGRDHRELLVADTPLAFARATIALLQNASLREEIAANAKRFVLRHFHWETNLSKLDDIIDMLSKPSLEKVLG